MERAVAVCRGHRCAALLDPEGAVWDQLRDTVQASTGAVLVSTGCTGACAQAPVLAVAGQVQRHEGVTDDQVRIDLGQVTWFGPVQPWQVRALCRWLAGPDAAALPAALTRAAFVPGSA